MDDDPWTTPQAGGSAQSALTGIAVPTAIGEGNLWGETLKDASASETGTNKIDPMSMAALDAAMPLPRRQSSSGTDPWATSTSPVAGPSTPPLYASSVNVDLDSSLPIESPGEAPWAATNGNEWTQETSARVMTPVEDDADDEIALTPKPNSGFESDKYDVRLDSVSPPHLPVISGPSEQDFENDPRLAISRHPSNSPTIRPVISPIPTRISLTPKLEAALEDPTSDFAPLPASALGGGHQASGWADGSDEEDDGWGDPVVGSSSFATGSSKTNFDNDGWGSPATARNPLSLGVDASNADLSWAVAAGARDSEPSQVGQTAQDDDWELARRDLERREAKAVSRRFGCKTPHFDTEYGYPTSQPSDELRHLEEEWKRIAGQFFPVGIGVPEPDTSGPLLVGFTMNNASATLESLSTFPDSLPPLGPATYKTSVTRSRYCEWLSTVKFDPNDSLAARVVQQHSKISAKRRARDLDEWASRSKLGEVDTNATEPISDAKPAASRWAFWKRQLTPVHAPVATESGAGVEKRHTPTPNAQLPRSTHSPTPSAASSREQPATSADVTTDVTPRVHRSSEDEPEDPQGDPDPSASGMSRFFGRLRPSRTPSATLEDNLEQDVEISTNDISFLEEVPSLQKPKHDDNSNFGDLLSMNDDIGRQSAPSKLRDVLADRAWAGGSSKLSGSASTQATPSKAPKAASQLIDSLLDLDFSASDDMHQGSNALATARQPSFAFNDLNTDFMAAPARQPLSVANPPESASHLGAGVPLSPVNSDDDGFGDFSAAHQQPTAQFDLSAFDDFATPAQPSPAGQIRPSGALDADGFSDFSFLEDRPIGQNQSRAPSSSASENLVANAAQRSGRWPAPPSPLPSLLPPPPSGRASTRGSGRNTPAKQDDPFDFGL